jgi:hypothetical protein
MSETGSVDYVVWPTSASIMFDRLFLQRPQQLTKVPGNEAALSKGMASCSAVSRAAAVFSNAAAIVGTSTKRLAVPPAQYLCWSLAEVTS